MSMTRKDYVAIAEVLRAVGDEESACASWLRTVEALAELFAAGNPSFDYDKFYRAAGAE